MLNVKNVNNTKTQVTLHKCNYRTKTQPGNKPYNHYSNKQIYKSIFNCTHRKLMCLHYSNASQWDMYISNTRDCLIYLRWHYHVKISTICLTCTMIKYLLSSPSLTYQQLKQIKHICEAFTKEIPKDWQNRVLE